MRRLLILTLFLVTVLAAGQQIYYESTPTLEWDAVTTNLQGDPYLSSDTITYEVYAWDMAHGDVTLQPIDSLLFVGEATTNSLQLAFPYYTEWAVAVRAVHTDGAGNVLRSGLAYSVSEGDTDGSPFWYVPVTTWVPARPRALRDSGM